MADLTPTEAGLTAEATAFSLVLQKLVRELSTLDSSMPARLEKAVRDSFAESKAAAGATERELFFRKMEGAVDTIFNAPTP